MYQTYASVEKDAPPSMSAEARKGPTYLYLEVDDLDAVLAAMKDVIVRGDALQDRFAGRRSEVVNRPARISRFAPQDFESRALGIILGGPRYFRVRRDRSREFRIRGWSWSECQLAQRFRVVLRHV